MAGNNNTDIELIAGLDESYSEAEILRVVKLIEKRLRANNDATIKLKAEIANIDDSTIKNTIDKLQSLLKSKDLKIDTKDSIRAITQEANAMMDIVGAAKKASVEKIAFMKANERLRDSAEDSVDAINRERTAMQSLDDVDNIMNNLCNSGREGASVFQRWGNSLRDALSAYTTLNLFEKSLEKMGEAGEKAIEIVRDLNGEIVDLRMSTGESYAGAKQLLSDYNSLGQEIGAVTESVSSAASDWLRQGYNVEDTNELIRSSMMLSKISQIDSASATEYLTSSMKGYHVAVSDVIGIVDKLCSVDMSAAVSADGLANGMSRVAGVAESAGISMDKLLGYLAVIGETTQVSMSSVGTALRTIFLRMQDIKTGKLELIDEDGTVELLSDVETTLKNVGIDLRATVNEFNNSGDVLDSLAEKWDTLSSVQQAALGKAFSGQRQGNMFRVLMENYETASKYMDVASQSAGSSEEKFGYYLESLESKTNSLIASLENLATTTFDDSLLVSVMDVSKGIVDLTADTGILRGALVGLGSGATLYAFSQLAGFIGEATQEFANFNEAMNMVNAGTVATNDMQRLIDLTSGLSQSQTRLLISTESLDDAQRMAILTQQYLTQGMSQELSEATARATLNTWNLTTAQRTLASASVTTTNVIRGMFYSLMSNPIAMVTLAVTAGATALHKFKQAQEEVIQSAREASNVYQDNVKSVEDYTARYNELRSALLEARGDEEATYAVKQQLLDLQNELNDKYASEYGALNLVTDAYKDQTEAIKNYNKEVANSYLNEERKGINWATKQMTKDRDYVLSGVDISVETDEGKALKEVVDSYVKEGMYLLEGANGTFQIHLDTDAQNAYDTINAFENDVREKAKELGDEHLFDSILDISSISLNEAKETIDKYGDIFRQALMAELVVDDGKATVYNEALKAVEDYNNAVLASEDPYSDEKVANAKKNLDEVKAKINENEAEWGKYSSVTDEVFAQADTRLLEFNQELQNNKELLADAKSLEGLNDLEIKSFNPGENESYDRLKESAESYNVSVGELIDTLIRLGIVQGEIQSSEPEIEVASWNSKAFSDTIQSYEEGYSKLISAQEEWNQAKSISAETYADLEENGLLQYLDATSEGLTINKDKLLENAETAKQKATADLQAAMMSDLLKIALGNVDTISDEAKTVIAQLGDNTATAGDQALESVAKWATFGSALTTIMAQARGEDRGFNGVSDEQKKQMEAVYDYYNDWKDKIGKIDITTPARTSGSSKSTQKEVDIMAELNSEMDEYQSKLEAVKSARETYNEYGKITVDQAQDIIDADFKLLAAYGSEEEALERLGKAKLNEMQIQLARNAIDTINNITSEATATEYLAGANEHLANSSLNATEAMLQQAVAAAKLRGTLQGQAAETILKGYQNGAMMLGQVDFGFNLQEAENAKKEQEKAAKETTKEFKKMVDWIEKFLDNLSRKTDKLMDKIDKFLSWQKKNSMINRAIKSTDNEITQNQKAYQAYMKKANSVGLSKKYINMIQNGSLNVETITDEGLSNKIDDYLEWYDKAQKVKDSIEELYEQERELIHQKLDNVIDYYSDMDSYLSSVTSKIESLIDLNESMGKRSSLTELVKQFSDVSAQLSNVAQKTSEIKTNVTEINFGESESVKDAIAKNRQEQIDSIQAELDNLYLSSETSGTYKKLELDIKKKEDKIKDYENKGWDETKSKKYEKLWAELDDLYDLQAELDAYATSNNISAYKKVYTKFQKLENKIDSGKDLKPSEQKKYDSYWEQLEEMRISADNEINSLKAELGLWEGTIAPETNVEKAEKDLLSVQEELEDTATYQKLEQNIEKTENKIADLLDGREYDELSNKQKKTYDKLTKTLEDYYDRKKALDENATADNVAEYNKIYIAWKKLQYKLDAGKNLSTSQWKQYNKYTEQLKEFEQAKDALVSDLDEKLDEARNPKDKLEIIKAEYEKSAEGIYDSYQRQIDGVKDAIKETAQYQNLRAKIDNLETKKDISGLNADDEKRLSKYKAKLEALEEGASVENLSDYISTWDKFYKLQQKLDKNGTLSDGDAKNYDTYKAKLEKWNEEKQQQISDLTSMMEDELEALQKTYVENVSEAESEISEYYANLYDLAKQIAEYNLGTLEEQLALLDSYISYYQQIVDLYNRFSDDKLSKLLSDLDIDVVEGQDALYAEYLEQLQKKYDTTLSKINEYKELLGALDEDNFESSMQLFQKTMETYRANGEEDKANQLQKVLDLLNERAVDANNWGEYADEWANEWEKALADAKTELIGIAGSIQDVNDQLREIKFSNITGAITELSNAQDMLSSIIGLINDDWMFNADGDLTQYGLTKVGLLVEQMEQAKQEANKYAELIQSIESMRNTYSSEDAYKQAMHEAKMNYLTSLGDLQNYQDSIVSILTKADEAVVDSLKDVIEKRKEALRKKKELYDYDKSIKSSQKEIDSIKAQIHALESLSDTTDAATKAKLAQLNADLLEKEEALKETKDEHTYNLQIDALDEFLESLNDTMNNTTDSINKSFETYIEAINSALKLYGENKEWLNDWSNKVLDTVTGMGNTVGGSGVDLDVSSKDAPTVVTETGKIASDDIHFYGTGKNENVQKLIDYFTNNSVLVRAEESPLLTANPEMMQFMQNYVPQMAVSVNHTIPEMMRNREPAVVNVHYDELIHIDKNSSIDENFVKNMMPKMIDQSFKELYRQIKHAR